MEPQMVMKAFRALWTRIGLQHPPERLVLHGDAIPVVVLDDAQRDDWDACYLTASQTVAAGETKLWGIFLDAGYEYDVKAVVMRIANIQTGDILNGIYADIGQAWVTTLVLVGTLATSTQIPLDHDGSTRIAGWPNSGSAGPTLYGVVNQYGVLSEMKVDGDKLKANIQASFTASAVVGPRTCILQVYGRRRKLEPTG